MFNSLIIFCGQYLISVPVLVLVIYFILVSWAQKSRLILLSVIAMTVAYALARIASDLYNDPRPFVVGHFKPLIDHTADNGFPSDHMLLASTIAMIVFYFNKKMGIALWVVAFVIGFSRVYAGIHHTVDIVGSTVIGIIAGAIAYYIAMALRKKNKDGQTPIQVTS